MLRFCGYSLQDEYTLFILLHDCAFDNICLVNDDVNVCHFASSEVILFDDYPCRR